MLSLLGYEMSGVRPVAPARPAVPLTSLEESMDRVIVPRKRRAPTTPTRQ